MSVVCCLCIGLRRAVHSSRGIPIECGVSECHREASIMRSPGPTRGSCVIKRMSGSPETLDVTSDGIMRKGSIDNEGMRSVFLKILRSKRRFSFAPFDLTNFTYYKKGHVVADEFFSLRKNVQQSILII